MLNWLFYLPHVYFLAAADGLGSIAIDTTQLNMSVTDPTAWATAMNNLGMVPVGLAGQQLVTGKVFLFLKALLAPVMNSSCPLKNIWNVF